MFIQQKVKLTDFGITHTVVSPPPSNPYSNLRKVAYTDPQILSVYLSTYNSSQSTSIQFPDFSQIHSSYYNLQTQKSDIYSLGVIFWEISCGRTPFSEHKNPPPQELANAIVKGLREIPTKDVPAGYFKLYTLCWDMDPEKRPRSENVVTMCKELINNGDSTKGVLEKNGISTVTSRGIEEGSGSKMPEQNSKRMTRMSDIDLQTDALAAELWLHNQEIEEKRQMGLIDEGDEYYGQEYGYSFAEQSTGQLIEDEQAQKAQDISTGSQQNRQSQDLDSQRMKSQKWKNKAKNFVKRLSGRKSQTQDFNNNLNIYEDGLDEEDTAAGWTSVNIAEVGKIDSYNTQISQVSPIIEGKKPDNNIIGHGSHKPIDNLDNLEIGEPGPSSTFRRPIQHIGVPASPKAFLYSDQCRSLFSKNKWKLNSQPCYAAYHARIGDIEGIRWHVEHFGDWVLNAIQEVSSPRNSYRRPLEALPLEAIMYCPAQKLLPTLTYLKKMGSNLNCIDSYTGGTCINYLSQNSSLLTTSYKSNSYSPLNPTTFNNINTQGIYFKKVLIYLLEQGLDINSQNFTGDTLLSSLLFKWHPQLSSSIIEFLIDQGANPNLENFRGGTPLGYTLLATRFENGGGPFKKVLKILKILLKGGGNCNYEVLIPGRRLKNLGWVCVDISVNLTKYQQQTLIETLIEWGCEFGSWDDNYRKKRRKRNRMESEESGIFGKFYADELSKIESNEKGKHREKDSENDDVDDDDIYMESDKETDENVDETEGAGVGGQSGTIGTIGTITGSGILNADYSEQIDAIYDETDDDGNESPVLPSGQGGGSLLTKRLKGKNLKFETPIRIPPLFSSPPTSPLPPTASLPPIPVQNPTGQRGMVSARDIPAALLRPLSASASKSQFSQRGALSRSRPRPIHRLSLFFNPSPTTPTFKPNNPSNILVYAVQLNQLDMIKILLKRIYELSESRSIMAALKECGVSFNKKDSYDGSDNSFDEVIIPKEKLGFFEHLFRSHSHDGKYEIRKYLLTWYGKQGASKRKKTMLRIEKMKHNWTNKAKNGYFSTRGIDAEFIMVGTNGEEAIYDDDDDDEKDEEIIDYYDQKDEESENYSRNDDVENSIESLDKSSDLELIDTQEKEES
ncbi:calmodulin-dependent protein kinase [Gigaspora margarita]|nr:calmodulin-dependent protein kinase [Gigaspora margarita]